VATTPTVWTIVPAAFAAARQTFSRPLRRILWRSLGLTVLLLAAIWWGLVSLLQALVAAHPVSAEHPSVDALLVFLAGAGLLVGFFYALPVSSALVAGCFADDAAEAVERTDFPGSPPGRALSLPRSIAYGARFALLALAVNAVALLLVLVPGVNVVSFFGANAYLLGREYFELAAMRFVTPEEARRLRRAHRTTVLTAGAVLAGLMLVPVVNLATPIFGIAMMVHVHKLIAARAARTL
jgi:CysZ protein